MPPVPICTAMRFSARRYAFCFQLTSMTQTAVRHEGKAARFAEYIPRNRSVSGIFSQMLAFCWKVGVTCLLSFGDLASCHSASEFGFSDSREAFCYIAWFRCPGHGSGLSWTATLRLQAMSCPFQAQRTSSRFLVGFQHWFLYS